MLCEKLPALSEGLASAWKINRECHNCFSSVLVLGRLLCPLPALLLCEVEAGELCLTFILL